MKEAGQRHELEDDSLYTKLQKELPESMLAIYHCWVFESNVSESVATLRNWVIQESEFQTMASEMVHRLSGKGATSQTTQVLVS